MREQNKNKNRFLDVNRTKASVNLFLIEPYFRSLNEATPIDTQPPNLNHSTVLIYGYQSL